MMQSMKFPMNQSRIIGMNVDSFSNMGGPAQNVQLPLDMIQGE